ncbi:MAG TPA: hypothetical protein VK866_15645 [Acidimicrobiales bacterium]|nr:hypothetical protein [Acidimicrobiales bacterium]
MTSRWQATREKNDAAVAEWADRVLADTRFARWRTRRARVALVAAEIALIVATPVAWITLGAIAGIVTVLATFGVLYLLRRSVRVVADMPDHLLDERQLALRNAMYVEAYRYLAGLVVIMASAGLLAFVVRADDADTWTVDLTWNGVMAAFWVIQTLALALPTMAIALRDGGEVPVDPAT